MGKKSVVKKNRGKKSIKAIVSIKTLNKSTIFFTDNIQIYTNIGIKLKQG